MPPNCSSSSALASWTRFEKHFLSVPGEQGNEGQTRAVFAGSDETDEWLERLLGDSEVEQMNHPQLVARTYSGRLCHDGSLILCVERRLYAHGLARIRTSV